MKILNYQDICATAWNELCHNSDEAWLYHLYEWVQLEEKYWVKKNCSFGIMDNGELLAIFPLYFVIVGLGSWSERLLVSGHPRQVGFAMRNTMEFSKRKTTEKIAMEKVLTLGVDLDIDRIHLSVSSLAPCNLGETLFNIPFWGLNANFFLGTQMGPLGIQPVPGFCNTIADQIVNLSLDELTLFNSFEPECRRAIRKAENSGLIALVLSDGQLALKNYYKLAQKSALKTKETIASVDYYDDVIKVLNEKKMLLFFVRHGEIDVAALWVLMYKGRATFFAGVSDPDYLPLRVNDFIQWSAIKYLRNEGCQWYRLGPYFPNVPKEWPIEKVSRFKSKFGAESFLIMEGSYFRKPEKYYNSGLERLNMLCKIDT